MRNRLDVARARRARGEGGFTLVELLVVVIIITVISAIAVPIYLGQRGKANDAKMEQDLSSIASLLSAATSTNSPVTFTPNGSTLATASSTDAGLRSVTVDGTLTVTGFASGDVPDAGDCVKITREDGANDSYCLPGESAGGGSTPPSSSAPPQVAPLALEYSVTQFTTGSNLQTIAPTVTGGSGAKTYSLSGTLPTSVAQASDFASTGVLVGPASSQWGFQATQLAVGYQFACALTSQGTVKCWGNNTSGQLGDGTNDTRYTPGDVLVSAGGAALSNVIAIGAGNNTACALLSNKTVKCWGSNFIDIGQQVFGFLGNGTTNNSNLPTTVLAVGESAGGAALANISSISVGSQHSCAIAENNTTYCWGYNSYGQLGNGGTGGSTKVPVEVYGSSGLFKAASISVGTLHTCAVTTAGAAQCWGNGSNGKLGQGTNTDDKQQPAQVFGLTSGVLSISAGYSHTCAIVTGGAVKCWGDNTYGQLGTNQSGSSFNTNRTPLDVNGLTSGATSVFAGGNMTCAVAGGAAKCWGLNDSGQLGAGNTTNAKIPTTVSGLTGGVSAISRLAGGSHACAVVSGVTKCWGWNNKGQLGTGATEDSLTPVAVSGAGAPAGFPANITVSVADASGSTSVAVTLGIAP